MLRAYDGYAPPAQARSVSASDRERRAVVGAYIKKFRGAGVPKESVDAWLENAAGLVHLEVLVRGAGRLPRAGDRLTLHLLMAAPGGSEADGLTVVLDSRADAAGTQAAGRALEVRLGDGAVIPGLEMALAQMQAGESAEFTLPPELAYGEAGLLPALLPGRPLFCRVELLSVLPAAGQM